MIPDLDENYLSKQNFLDLYNDSDKLSINESFESNFLDFNNSLYFDLIKLPNIGTQPTSSLNNNINSLLLSKENKGNNQKKERKEKGKKEEKEEKKEEKEKKEKKEKKMLGRKKKGSNEKGKHDKYSQDNIIRRIKY